MSPFLASSPTFLDGDLQFGRVDVGHHLLVGPCGLVEELHEQLASLAVLAAPDHGELVQLLGHHPGVLQRVLQGVTAEETGLLETLGVE